MILSLMRRYVIRCPCNQVDLHNPVYITEDSRITDFVVYDAFIGVNN